MTRKEGTAARSGGRKSSRFSDHVSRVRLAGQKRRATRSVAEPGKRALNETRSAVREGWYCVADLLERQQRIDLVALVRGFARAITPRQAEKDADCKALCSR